jgi:hypothetical protein
MALYVDELDAQIVPEGPPPQSGLGPLRPEEFQTLVNAVIREIERRQKHRRTMKSESEITGQNRPPSLGS